ncbi:hypothetical protein HN903_01540 [archaeon]|jgi:hypothetical protein|nr:hypothetical protein [archaeon]MBT7128415.1 hypothetical protein [archaeon]
MVGGVEEVVDSSCFSTVAKELFYGDIDFVSCDDAIGYLSDLIFVDNDRYIEVVDRLTKYGLG